MGREEMVWVGREEMGREESMGWVESQMAWCRVVSFHIELIVEISADDAVAVQAEVEAAPASCCVTYLYASWPAMTATFPLRINEQLEERNGGCCYRGQNRG